VSNIVAHASDGVSDDIQRRVVAYWSDVDPELGGERCGIVLGQRGGVERDARDPCRPQLQRHALVQVDELGQARNR